MTIRTYTSSCARFFNPICVALLLALVASAGFPGTVRAQDEQAPGSDAIFYPPLPNEPRLQYLTKFSSPLDVSTGSQGMRKFLFGGEENEGHLVNKPYGLAVFEGAVYVTDMRGNGYGVFDVAAGRARFVKPSGSGALKKPGNITIDADGTRYITDTDRRQVLVFDRNDRFLRAFGKEGQYKPGDVAIVGERLYLTDLEHHQVHVLDKRTGEVLLSFGGLGSEPGQFTHPTSLALSPDETLWVTDTTNFRVQQFTLEGEFISVVGSVGLSPGTFARPKGLAIDGEGLLYIVDSAFANIQILDPDGTSMLFFGQPGEGRGNINLPTVVKIDYDNVQYFQKYAHPDFTIEYLVLVASQFGLNKVVVFGFGSLDQ